MSLPAAAHAAVQAETKRARNAAARTNRLRVAAMRILHATDAEGAEYTLALGASEPDRAYVLRRNRQTGEWGCTCFTNRWQRRCAHLEAIEAAGEG